MFPMTHCEFDPNFENMLHSTIWAYLKRTDCNLIPLGASMYRLERPSIDGACDTVLVQGDLFTCARGVAMFAMVTHDWDPY